MGIPLESFRRGDVYIDFPYEEVMFRFEHSGGRVFRKFYGESFEVEVDGSSKLYNEACEAGTETDLDTYRKGRERRPP